MTRNLIKRSSAPSVSKGFHIAAEDVKATQRFVVHSGSESYPMGQETHAVSVLGLQKALTATEPAVP